MLYKSCQPGSRETFVVTKEALPGVYSTVPEERHEGRFRSSLFRSNLKRPVCISLLGVLFLVQMADLVTTFIALQDSRIEEMNPLLRPMLAASPWLASAFKLTLVGGVCLWALSRLRGNKAIMALVLATSISALAPVLNMRFLF